MLVATALTAVLSLIIPEIAEIQDMPTRVYVALLFGTIVSATDPVAVVAMLKELGICIYRPQVKYLCQKCPKSGWWPFTAREEYLSGSRQVFNFGPPPK